MRLGDKQFAVLTILAMEFNNLAMSAVSPALADIGRAFPEISQTVMSMLSTVPALICVPVSIFSTSLVGRKITFRNLAIIGSIFQLLGGLMPFFASTFYEILAWRCIFGIGMGVMAPLGSTLMFSIFSKEEAEIQAGRDSMSNSIGAVVYQLLGGLLCAQFGWRYTFLIYTLLVPTTALTLAGMFHIRSANQKFIVSGDRRSKSPARYGAAFWGWCSLYAVYCILFYPLITDSSVVVLNNGYGTANSVSIILSVYTMFGVLGGVFYQNEKVRSLNTKIFSLIFFGSAIAFLIIVAAKSVLAMVVGSAIFGIGYGLFTAAITIFAGYSVPKELRVGVMARILVFTGIGEFISAFAMDWIKTTIFHSEYERFSFAFSAVCLAALAVVFLIKPRSHRLSAEDISEMV